MRLLLSLFAMLAGLTGLVAGQPAAARAAEPAAIASAFAASVEQVSDVAKAWQSPPVIVRDDGTRVETAAAPVLLPRDHKVDERRIE
ncbi:MAG: hypothetical protein JSS55_15470 [Proteobacteria bacterium]|nr:hypothetical protein [Pseudomonadota bacterium]